MKPVAGAAPLDRATEEVAGAGQAPSPLVLLGHDLRAALADMRAGLELIRALALPAATQDTLRRCLASGDALSRLIDQSVLVCLGQASPGLSCPVSFDTAAFLDEVEARWAGVARDNGHRFVLRAADLPGALYMDRTGVERILANLIGNALRHTPPGEVVLSLGQAEGAAMLRLELADSGPGFAPAVLAAFGRDLSLPDHLRRPGGGFGLQSVGYLVQAMGGSCEIGNRPEGGGLVRVVLPLLQIGGAVAPAPVPPELLAGFHILVADDSAAQRSLLHGLLTRAGAEICGAADGAEAIALLRRGQPMPDLIVLDAEMPGTSGVEVLRWMAETLPPDRRPPVLALTAHGAALETQALLQAGAARVARKPVADPAGFLWLVRELLGPVPTALPATYTTLRRLAEIAGPEAAQELFARLGEDLARARAGLAQAAAKGGLAALRQHSHVLIALAGTAGETALHEAAADLNAMAHAGGPIERLTALAARMDAGIGELIRTVQTIAAQSFAAQDTAR